MVDNGSRLTRVAFSNSSQADLRRLERKCYFTLLESKIWSSWVKIQPYRPLPWKPLHFSWNVFVEWGFMYSVHVQYKSTLLFYRYLYLISPWLTYLLYTGWHIRSWRTSRWHQNNISVLAWPGLDQNRTFATTWCVTLYYIEKSCLETELIFFSWNLSLLIS